MAKSPKREWALIDVTKKCLVMRGGKPTVILAKQPPRGEAFSNKYRRLGYDYASVELEHSAQHVGPPIYTWPDDQKAVVVKVISAKESKN
jgi:hypothetical protein